MKSISYFFKGNAMCFLLFVLMLSGALQTLKAQSFEPGYIVLNSKDTLYGSIKDRNVGTRFKKIRFKDKHGKVKRYTAEDILSYKAGIYTYESLWYAVETQFFKFEYYSRPGYGNKVFLKVLAKGRLSCYAMEFIQDDNDYMDEFELFLREGDNTMARATQGVFGLKKNA